MTQETQWSPMTCSCMVSYQWDDAEEPRVYRLMGIDRRCDRHGAMLIGDIHFAQLLDESSRVDRVLPELQRRFPQLFDPEDGGFLGSWRFDNGHALRMTLPGISTTAKNQFMSWANVNIGLGLVGLD